MGSGPFWNIRKVLPSALQSACFFPTMLSPSLSEQQSDREARAFAICHLSEPLLPSRSPSHLVPQLPVGLINSSTGRFNVLPLLLSPPPPGECAF